MPAPITSPRLAARAIRGYVAAICAAVALAAGAGPWLSAAITLFVLFVEPRNPLTLKNYFLVYVVGLFGIGGYLLVPDSPGLQKDLLLYMVAFLVAYAIAYRPSGSSRVLLPLRPGPTSRVQTWLKGLVLVHVVLVLIPQLYQYGIRGFYGGQGLVDLIGTYGQESVGGGVSVIINSFLSTVTTAAAVIYVVRCIAMKERISYGLLGVVLVLTPVLLLERSSALLGAISLVAIFACENRFGAERHRQLKRQAVPAVALVLAFGAALGIGTLRGVLLADPASGPSSKGSVAGDVLRSEFSPIVLYDDVKSNIDTLGYRHGSNIVGALATRFVPRAWLPNKPLTSAAYYMEKIRPGAYRAGYAIAPSIFGVSYLNFGFAGSLAMCMLLGGFAARLDHVYRGRRVDRLPEFLIVFFSFYSLLREDLSNSLARLILVVVAYLLLQRRVVEPNAGLTRGQSLAGRLRPPAPAIPSSG